MTKLDVSSDLLASTPEVLSYMVSALRKVLCSRMRKMLAKDLREDMLNVFREEYPRWTL